MAEVKKSYFVALDSGEAAAATIAVADSYNAAAAGAATTDDRNAFLLEPSGIPDLALDYEEITRDVIRDSLLPARPARGIINTTGSLTFELHGGAPNTTALAVPDYHPLLKSAFGAYNYLPSDVAGITISSTAGNAVYETWTGIDLSGATAMIKSGTLDSPATGVLAGQIIVIHETVNNKYFVLQLTDVSTPATSTGMLMFYGGDPNVSPTFNLKACAAYYMPSDITTVSNFAIAYYRGNIVRELYAKCAVTSAEFPLNAGELILPVFNFNVGDGSINTSESGGNLVAGAYYDSSDGGYDGIFGGTALSTATDPLNGDGTDGTTAITSNTSAPLFAKAVDWKLEYADITSNTNPASVTWAEFDVSRVVDSVSFTINNTQATKRDIEATEGIAGYRVSERSVDISISAYYDEAGDVAAKNFTKLFIDPDDKYRIRLSAMMTTSTVKGNKCFIFAPRIAFKPVVGDEEGLFKYDISGSAEKDTWSGGTGFGEAALTCVFF